jgi:hypothetical protein
MDKREKIEKKKERLETKIKDCDDQIAEIEKAKALKAKIEKMKQEERLEKAEQKKLKQLQREYAREQDKIRKKNEQIAQKNKVVEKREAEKETKVKKDFNKREKYLKYGVDPNIKTLPKKKKVNVFKMLDYNQLQMEVNKYGYHYSFKKILMHYLIAVILAVAVGMVFKLKFYLIGVIVLAAIIFTPSIILTSVKGMYEGKRFYDVANYIETLLYSFRRKEKILDALEDTYTSYEKDKGKMGDCIAKAINHIKFSNSVGDVSKEALSIIEDEYEHNERMVNVHNFLIAVENNGGDVRRPVDLLLKERNMWDERNHSFQKEKTTVRRNIAISIICSVGLCVFLLYILGTGQMAELDIIHNNLVQITSTVAIIASMGMYVMAINKLSQSWLAKNTKYSDYQVLRNYFNAKDFDFVSEMKSSLLFSVIGVLLIVLGISRGIKVTIILGAALTIFFICAPLIAHSTAKKVTNKEITKAFPEWLMNVALLMQQDNVQVAIAKSVNTAPAVLRPDLTKLVKDFYKEPNSIKPYQNFLSDFDFPEIQGAMCMLYSITETGDDAGGEQINDLIDKQNILMDKAERTANEDTIASYSAYQMMPMLICIFKALLDMTVLVMGLMSYMNN